MTKRNGYYFHATRGLCKVNYFYEGASIYFFDKCAEERFTRGMESQTLSPMTVDQAIDTGLNDNRDYLYPLSLRNDFIRKLVKEPKFLLLLLYSNQVNNYIINYCKETDYEGDYTLKSVYKYFDRPGMVCLNFSFSVKVPYGDDEDKEINGSFCTILVSQTLFENFDEEAYDIWLEQALNKKQKEINESFDNQIDKLTAVKKSLVIK